MTKKENNLALFSGQEIRRFWDEKQEKWYFSVVDVVTVLAQTERPRKYWDDLKRKIKEEGGQLSEKIGQLKFLAKGGVAGRARKELEKQTGQSVISGRKLLSDNRKGKY